MRFWGLTVFEGRGIVRFFAALAVIERTGKYITVGLIFRGFEKSLIDNEMKCFIIRFRSLTKQITDKCECDSLTLFERQTR